MHREAVENRRRTWLLEARKRKDLTAKQVAEAVGISRSHYSMIEINRANPSGKVAMTIADFLEIDVNNFY